MITDAKRQGDPLAALRALPRGSLVILRDYDHPDRLGLARALVKACRRRGLLCSIAGSGELATRVRTGGLHLPEALAARVRTWRNRRKSWLITVSVHNLPAIRRAEWFGADAVLLAPVFPTESHPGAASLGILRFARLASAAGLPVYALGGVTAANMRRLKDTGAVGLAAIGALKPPPVKDRGRRRAGKSARN